MVPKMIRNLFPSATPPKREAPPLPPQPDPEIAVLTKRTEDSQKRLDRAFEMTELLLRTMKRDQDAAEEEGEE